MDTLAQEIVSRSIERKQHARADIRDYRYDAYVKFSARKLGTPPDSAASILLVTEAKSSVHLESPGRYQETIVARRKSSDMDPQQGFLTVGEIVNLDRDLIHIWQYSMISPIADNALGHYDYAIQGLVEVDGRTIYRLAVRPRTEAAPLRAAMLILHHDFDRLLFLASRHPRIRGIPFTLNVNGGVFWTDFVNHSTKPGDSLMHTARRPYAEVGFGVGNLTPFLAPFNFEANFTWQLSTYATQRFQFGLGLTP